MSELRKRFKLGFFSHVHSGSTGAGPYLETRDLFVAAEELGFDAGFIGQHHLAGDHGGRQPSPLLGLSIVATATTRIELGTSVVVLPLEHPVRLAEDVSVLDAISGGRVQLGLGTGTVSFDKYAAFGEDVEHRHEVYDRKLLALLSVLAGEPVPGAGGAVLSPPAAPDLLSRIWGTPSTPESARRAARAGTGILYGTSNLDIRARQRPIIDAYLEEWAVRGAVDAPEALRAAARPRIGAIRMIYPAASRAAAIDELERFIDGAASRLPDGTGEIGRDEVLVRSNVYAGSPAELEAALLGDAALLPEIDYLLPVTVVLESGSRPGSAARAVDRAIAGLERIATSVAPRLGWSRVPDPLHSHHETSMQSEVSA